MANSLPDPYQMLVLPSESTSQASTTSGEEFLRLRIGDNVPVLLPIQQLVEVLSIPEHQIMPMPHMPAWMMGIYNWRGEILWVADLGYLCGLTPWYQYPIHRSTYSAIILNLIDHSQDSTLTKAHVLGLVVQQVEDMERCNLDEIQSLSPVPISSILTQLSAGYWQKSDGTVSTILSGEKLLSIISQARKG